MVQEKGLGSEGVSINQDRYPEPEIICIVGNAGAGKDTIGLHLMRAHVFTICKFAAPLYRALSAIFNNYTLKRIDKNLIISQSSNFCTWRRALQTLGTEWGREIIGDDIWCNLLQDTIKKYQMAFYYATVDSEIEESVRIVITDCRFVNEWNFIKNNYPTAKLWYVQRPSTLLSDEVLSHASEQEISALREQAHARFINDATILDLCIKVNHEFNT